MKNDNDWIPWGIISLLFLCTLIYNNIQDSEIKKLRAELSEIKQNHQASEDVLHEELQTLEISAGEALNRLEKNHNYLNNIVVAHQDQAIDYLMKRDSINQYRVPIN